MCHPCANRCKYQCLAQDLRKSIAEDPPTGVNDGTNKEVALGKAEKINTAETFTQTVYP